jgi:hypothetical protein
MSQGKSFFMMFTVLEGGVIEAIEFNKDKLTPDQSIIVMDEENQIVWLWHGKKRALVPRRMALRQAQSLKGHGYQAGNAILGRDLNTLIEIDDRKVGREPESTENNEKFINVLNCQFSPIGNLVFIKGEEIVDEIAQPTTPKVIPSIDAAPAPVVDTGDYDEKKGAVIMAILKEFKDLWVSRKEDGSLALEQMDGKICSFKIENGEIKFLPGSFFEISKEKKEAILQNVASI